MNDDGDVDVDNDDDDNDDDDDYDNDDSDCDVENDSSECSDSSDDNQMENPEGNPGSCKLLLRLMLITFFNIIHHFCISNNAASTILSFISFILGMWHTD